MIPGPRRVEVCPPELRVDALRRLHAGLPRDQQMGLVQAFDHAGAGDSPSWNGLLIAIDADSSHADADLAGVIWVQSLPGNTSLVWPPAATCRCAEELFSAAAAYVEAHRIPLAQIVVAEHDGYSATMLQRSGFPRLAELYYLFAEVAPSPPPAKWEDAATVVDFDGLQFAPYAGQHADRLAATLEQTYVGTHDCAALDGVRPLSDVLEGYRAQGVYLPRQWYLVGNSAGDVGALLLAAHPAAGNWEIIYMGVIATARGKGVGTRMVRFAQLAAGCGGAERLVLAVDAANEPALAAYRRAGLVEWDRRTVYARLQAPTNAR